MCGPHVVCGHCGNNCCNGGSGDGCADRCAAAYALQDSGVGVGDASKPKRGRGQRRSRRKFVRLMRPFESFFGWEWKARDAAKKKLVPIDEPYPDDLYAMAMAD